MPSRTITTKKKKKVKSKKENLPIQYISLSIHRKWPNPLNYFSHLKIIHANTQTLIYDIDRILNLKWIDLRRPQIIDEYNDIHQISINHHFQHQLDRYQSKYYFFKEQFRMNELFSQEGFRRWIEFIDRLEKLYEYLERSQRNIYEYRLTLLKNEFEREKEFLNDLFLNHELKELDDQIHLLNIRRQKEFLQQDIRYQVKERQLKESFIKDIHQLQSTSQQQIDQLRLILNRLSRSNDQQLFPISKNCHRLFLRIEQAKNRMNNELTTIIIVKKKINETKMKIDQIESKRLHLNDKLNMIKNCSVNTSNCLSKTEKNRNQVVFRRLCTLVDDVKKTCLRKLHKAQRILLLADQCHRFELEDEQIFFPQIRSNPCSCNLDYYPDFDQLTLLWQRLAHVQMHIHLLKQENTSHKQTNTFFRAQLCRFT